MPTHHLFVQVVPTATDHFGGIKRLLAEAPDQRINDIRLTEAEFAIVRQIEYGDQRMARPLRYPAIFKSLYQQLDAALAGCGGDRATVYFADEGVWAVMWADYRRRRKLANVRGVNVQHGIALLKRPSLPWLRRAINAAARMVTGFPAIGYGSLAGAGPGPFELYLTYDQASADFITKHSGCAAIAAPHVIKADLIERFNDLPRRPNGAAVQVLFAMNVPIKGSPIKCDARGMFEQLLPLARALEAAGARLVIRLHPGADQNAERRDFADHPIARHAAIDESQSLHHALAQADIVMSLLSTVLWEAGLLGLVAVQVTCRCCDPVELGYEREILSLDEPLAPRLASLLARARGLDRAKADAEIARQWGAVQQALATL